MFDKLSQELREARERSGLSLQQLANKSRIDLKFLQAIEDGNLSFLPELYVKAFLKEYSRFVGLNEIVILKKYQAIKEGKAYQEPETPQDKKKEDVPEKKDNPEKEPIKEVKREPVRLQPTTTQFDSVKATDYSEKSGTNNQRNIIILSGVAAVLIIFGLVYYFFFRSNNEIIVPEKPYDEIVQENSERYTDLEPKKDSIASVVTSDSLHLLIRSSDTTWVKILIDDTRQEEFILFPRGQKQLTAASKYKVVFGNSKSIQLDLNNKPLEFVSQGKKVSNITIDSGGVHYEGQSEKKTK